MDKNKKTQKAQDVVKEYRERNDLYSDPQGSYTGRPENPREIPVQDADDL